MMEPRQGLSFFSRNLLEDLELEIAVGDQRFSRPFSAKLRLALFGRPPIHHVHVAHPRHSLPRLGPAEPLRGPRQKLVQAGGAFGL